MINLAVVLSHSLEAAEIVAFPQRVVSSLQMRRAAEELWQVMHPRWSNLEPADKFSTVVPQERLSVSDVTTAWMSGQDIPSFTWAGFNLRFGKRAVAAVHIEKLVGFVLDLDGLRGPLQRCAHALARELRSSQVVYGPDSFSPFGQVLCVEEGVSVEEILSNARRLCDIPAATIREMAEDNEEQALRLDSRCYCVEAVPTVFGF